MKIDWCQPLEFPAPIIGQSEPACGWDTEKRGFPGCCKLSLPWLFQLRNFPRLRRPHARAKLKELHSVEQPRLEQEDLGSRGWGGIWQPFADVS